MTRKALSAQIASLRASLAALPAKSRERAGMEAVLRAMVPQLIRADLRAVRRAKVADALDRG